MSAKAQSPCLWIAATNCDAQPVHAKGCMLPWNDQGQISSPSCLLWHGPHWSSPKLWYSVALMFCYASLILKITMALVERWVVLIWVACFASFFFSCHFQSVPVFLSSGNQHVVSHRFSRGKRLRLLQGRRNRPSLGSSRTPGPLAVFRRGGGHEWGSVFTPLTHAGWHECFEIWWLRRQARKMWRLFEPVSN